MNMNEIRTPLRELRLSGIAETLSTRVMLAQAAQEPFLETFAAMLQDELDRRRSRLTERRFKRSGLDERPAWTSTGVSSCPRGLLRVAHLKFIGEGANALIIGKPGTGKTRGQGRGLPGHAAWATTCVTWKPTPSSPATGWPVPRAGRVARSGSNRTCWCR